MNLSSPRNYDEQ